MPVVGQNREASHSLLVAFKGLPACSPVAIPHPDCGVIRSGYDHVLRTVVTETRLKTSKFGVRV